VELAICTIDCGIVAMAALAMAGRHHLGSSTCIVFFLMWIAATRSGQSCSKEGSSSCRNINKLLKVLYFHEFVQLFCYRFNLRVYSKCNNLFLVVALVWWWS